MKRILWAFHYEKEYFFRNKNKIWNYNIDIFENIYLNLCHLLCKYLLFASFQWQRQASRCWPFGTLTFRGVGLVSVSIVGPNPKISIFRRVIVRWSRKKGPCLWLEVVWRTSWCCTIRFIRLSVQSLLLRRNKTTVAIFCLFKKRKRFFFTFNSLEESPVSFSSYLCETKQVPCLNEVDASSGCNNDCIILRTRRKPKFRRSGTSIRYYFHSNIEYTAVHWWFL